MYVAIFERNWVHRLLLLEMKTFAVWDHLYPEYMLTSTLFSTFPRKAEYVKYVQAINVLYNIKH